MKNKVASVGIFIAIIAITIAIFQNNIRVQVEPTYTAPPAKTFTAKIFDASIQLFLSREDKTTEEAMQEYDTVSYTYMGLGLLAFVLGVISFLRKENLRFSGVAASLGVIAIAWEFIVIALGVIFIIAVVIAVLSQS